MDYHWIFKPRSELLQPLGLLDKPPIDTKILDSDQAK